MHADVVVLEIALDIGVGIAALADKRLSAQFLGRDMARPPRGKTGRRNADKRVCIQRYKVQLRRTGVRQEPQLHRAALEPQRDIGIAALVDLNVNAGILGLESGHQLRQPDDAGAVEYAQTQHAFVQAVDLGNGLVERFVAGQHAPDGRQQAFGCCRHGNTGLGACEQREAALVFHPGHGVADGGGGQVQPLRRAGKAAFLCDGGKDLASQQRHKSTASRYGKCRAARCGTGPDTA